MKTNRLFSFLSFCILLLAACHKNDGPPPSLTVDISALNLTADAGKTYLQITSNVEWSLSGLPTGVTAKPATGKGDTKVEITYPANTGAEAITATLALSATGVNTINIAYKQLGSAPSILADKTTIVENGAGKTETVVITANTAWKLTMPEGLNWIAADRTAGGAGATTITFTIAQNRVAKERTATIAFSEALGTASLANIAFTQLQPDIIINARTNNLGGGESMFIEGSGFSPVKEENTVTISGKPATVVEATPELLRVTVPAKAGNGALVVKAGTKTSQQIEFTYHWVWRAFTYAGNGSSLVLNSPGALVVDNDLNLYVAEWNSFKISKIDPNKSITLFAGAGQGYIDATDPTQAKFQTFESMTIDKTGNIYVTDAGNLAVRKIATDGKVTTQRLYASDEKPYGLTSDETGNVYMSAPAKNNMQLLLTNGSSVYFTTTQQPHTIAVGNNNLFMFDMTNFKFYKKNLTTGIEALYSGAGFGREDGPAGVAKFGEIRSMVVDKDGVIYVCDYSNSAVRMIATDGTVTTISGKLGTGGDGNGLGEAARYSGPNGMAIDKNGDLYVADAGNNKIKKLVKE